MQTRHLVDPEGAESMSTGQLRAAFLVDELFRPGELRLAGWEADRTSLGSAVPMGSPLALAPPPEIKADTLNQRRELGIVNLGGPGSVLVDGERHPLGRRDGLYVGRGVRDVVFASDRESEPALFYLVSHPAHASHPTARVTAA